MDVFAPGDHGSTFGGNPLAAAVGHAALDLLVRERLSENAERMRSRLRLGLEALHCPMVADIRGTGLLIGVEFDAARISARAVCEHLLTVGILSKDTHGTVVRFAPPLTEASVSLSVWLLAAQVDEALQSIGQAFGSLEARRIAALETS